MKLLKFPLISFCLFLMIGICVGNYSDINPEWLLIVLAFLGVLLGVFYLVFRNKSLKSVWFGITTLGLMVILGMLLVYFHNPIHLKQHYTHHVDIHNEGLFTLKIDRKLKPTLYQDKYYVEVLEYNQLPVLGTVVLNIQKDSVSKDFDVGDVMVVKSQAKEISGAKNPYQFDYKNYLERHYVFLQINANTSELFHIKAPQPSLHVYADKLRSHMQYKLKHYGLQGDEFAIVNALLLGQRQDISEEVYNNFAAAGAIHILAVSGLHVGIIMLLLNWILKPLTYLKHGAVTRTIFVILFLWSFAIIAGLSPSVSRAVTMFTAVTIAINFKRANNIYNTLAVSAFILLLLKPNFLFEVGFQMSYLAVLGIVSIRPILYNYWKPKFWLLDKFWSLFTVTLAAQIGVLPVSLFYFHQFPALFFVSNLIIIPFMGIILGLGILVIFLSSLDWIHPFIMEFYADIISTLNAVIAFIASAERFFIRDIPLNFWQMTAFYLLIISSISALKYRSSKSIQWALSAVILVQVVYAFSDYGNAKSEFVVFQKNRHTLIGVKNQHQLILHSNLDSLQLKSDKILSSYKVGNQIKIFETEQIQDVYQFNEALILVVDSLGVYNVPFKPSIVLLRDSPKINLERLIDNLQPQQIIADGSNYRSYVGRWKATCTIKKLPFHHTYEMGAFILKD